MLIKLGVCGAVLTGRDIAWRLREQVERALDSGERVEFDCTGVECIARSFSDELWGKIVEERGKRILKQMRFSGLEPFVKMCIALGVAGRLPGVQEEALKEDAE